MAFQPPQTLEEWNQVSRLHLRSIAMFANLSMGGLKACSQ